MCLVVCCCSVAKLCLTLRCHGLHSPPGSSVHEISQARILEWVAISFSRGSSQPRDGTLGLLHCRRILYCLSHQGDFPGDGSVVEPSRACLPVQEMQVRSLDEEDPWEEEMAPHPSILAWRIPWTEEPGGLQSVGSQRVRHN